MFISIATSSLLKDSLPADSKQQPWIVRIAASLCDTDGKVLEGFCTSIRAGGRKIDSGASAVHGITSTQADRGGVYELFVLGAVCGLKASGKRATDYPGLASMARYVVCWNADFVRAVIGGMFARHGEPADAWVRPGLTFIGLQQAVTPFCRLPSSEGGYRLPKRDEAVSLLLGLPERVSPTSPESNLDIEKLIFYWLQERKAFEAEAA